MRIINKGQSNHSHHQSILSVAKYKFSTSKSNAKQSSTETKSKSSNSNILGTKLFVWGQMQGSSLGLGTNDRDTSLPIQLDDIDGSGYRDIALGNTHCGIVTGKGDVYMFGTSHYGELGLDEQISNVPLKSIFGNNATINTPTKIESLSNIKSLSLGGRHSAAIDENGNVFTWGWGGNKIFGCGGLGHGDKQNLNVPKQVDSLSNIVQISCGEKHTLCINEDGDIYSFGEGEHGRLGTGLTSNCKKPTLLTFFQNIGMKKVVAAKEYSFGLTRDDGILYGWGRNDRGQMGQGGGLAMDMYSCETIPVAIGQCNDILDIGLSQSDVLCVDNDGLCYYWGERVFLEPHVINEERFIDEENKPKGKVIAVDITGSIMCFVTDKGELFTCNKTFGMKSDIFPLGHGSVQPFKEAKQVSALKDEFVKKIVANDQRCIALAK